MPSPVKEFAATVATGQTTSSEVDIADCLLLGVILPAEFDGTTLGFTVSTTTGGTFYTLRDGAGAAAVSYTVAASSYVALDPGLFAGVRYVKIVLGSQTGATAAKLVCRPL